MPLRKSIQKWRAFHESDTLHRCVLLRIGLWWLRCSLVATLARSVLFLLGLVGLIFGEDVLRDGGMLVHYQILLSENWAANFQTKLVSRVTSDTAGLFIYEFLDCVPEDPFPRRI